MLKSNPDVEVLSKVAKQGAEQGPFQGTLRFVLCGWPWPFWAEIQAWLCTAAIKKRAAMSIQTDGIRNTGQEKPRMRNTQEADVRGPSLITQATFSVPSIRQP